jgi:hypothetical protein|tara:strand:- start:177 stop:521 length:345 start_codon:yes stop_codon:yes gene_type:complete
MSFFKSEVVRAEMTEISELQEEVYQNVFRFPSMSKEEKLFHVALLEKLLNKQQILYTRLSLSDDPEAKQMRDKIAESANMVGLPSHVDIRTVFKNMETILQAMRQKIDEDGTDM